MVKSYHRLYVPVKTECRYNLNTRRRMYSGLLPSGNTLNSTFFKKQEWKRRKHTFQLPAINLNYLSFPQKSIQDPLMWSHYVPGVSHHLVHSARHEGWVDLLPTDHTKATTRRKNDTMKEMCPGCEDLLCSSLTSPHPECPEEQEAQTTDQREAVAC